MATAIEFLKAILIGIVQGITEWLPISSTGHMILLNDLVHLNVSDAFWEMFEVVIQLGSILAVVVLYFSRLWPFAMKKNIGGGDLLCGIGKVGIKRHTMVLWLHVLIAAVPAGVVGVLFNDWFDAHFYNPVCVSVSLIVYGVLFIVVEQLHRGKTFKMNAVEDIGYGTAFGVGVFQMLSLVPGTSRSGSTILGASILSVSRPAAAEFSFFLAVPVMLGASLLKGMKFAGKVAAGAEVFGGYEAMILAVGCIVAFVVSLAAIRFLMDFVKKHSFTAFGIYRIVLGVLVLLLRVFVK
ncbi:MAG: undecaprenyl-diphosphatase [Oscillospiraceae bacterium]|nr:MAG: undecaprenyl-diphosphatase [Oscillospiraceae bacterium]